MFAYRKTSRRTVADSLSRKSARDKWCSTLVSNRSCNPKRSVTRAQCVCMTFAKRCPVHAAMLVSIFVGSLDGGEVIALAVAGFAVGATWPIVTLFAGHEWNANVTTLANGVSRLSAIERASLPRYTNPIEIASSSVKVSGASVAIVMLLAARRMITIPFSNKWYSFFAGYARYTAACIGFAALRFLKPYFSMQAGCS
jgi:hypothetical protein